MNTVDNVRVMHVSSSEDTLRVDFTDGRSVHLPLLWYPRLYRATQAQRDNYQLIGQGYGVHWPDVDEDLSARSLALGKQSIEFTKQGKVAASSKQVAT
jgi:hypothetical protein